MERHWTVRSAEDLGRAIADIRHAREMTQTELALESGLRRDWLAKLETGRPNRVLDHLLRVLRRLGATVTIAWDDERA
jgi:transcriptional regulator with XRE-family HTH domain